MPLSVGTAKQYSGGAASTTLAVAITAASTEITVVDGSGLPDPTGTIPSDPNDPVDSGALPFVITIDRGNPSEEKILISGRTANNLTVQERGFDGTVATSHSEQAVVEHTIDAESFSRFEAHVGNPGEVDLHNIDQIEGLSAKISELDTHVALGTTDAHAISNIDGLQAALNLKASEADLTTAEGRITVNEGDIDNLESDVAAIGGDITTLQSDVSSNSGDITTLEGQVTAGLGLRQVETYTIGGSGVLFSKGTYPWLRAVRVRCVGGGGGGGGAGSCGTGEAAVGVGGAGGNYAESIIPVASLGVTELVEVGDGGAGGVGDASGTNGGTSSFGSHVVATGGEGGGSLTPSNNVSAVVGGTSVIAGSSGDIVSEGEPGNCAFVADGLFNNLSPGGNSPMGGGGRNGASGNGANGGDGTGIGGGGAGAHNRSGQGTARTGGSGSDGIVIVELYA